VKTLDQLGLALSSVPAPGSPYYGASAHQIALANVARAIREQVPITGELATDVECRDRRELVESALEHIGVERGPSEWWTLVCEKRPEDSMHVFAGVWAHSMEEALIETVLWRREFDGRHLITIAPDEHGAHHAQLCAARRKFELADERNARREAEIEASVTLW
jgi:hypothetical protein